MTSIFFHLIAGIAHVTLSLKKQGNAEIPYIHATALLKPELKHSAFDGTPVGSSRFDVEAAGSTASSIARHYNWTSEISKIGPV